MLQRLVFGTLLIGALASSAGARRLENWPYSRLMKEADVVVIGSAESSRDNDEQFRDNPWGVPFRGVETHFRVAMVLKGEPRKQIRVLHFRIPGDRKFEDGPLLVKFRAQPWKLDLTANGAKMNIQTARPEYMLFLKQGENGRFEPVSGRVDPQLSVRVLHSADDWLESIASPQ